MSPIIAWAKFGLWGKDALRWVDGSLSDWRRLTFLIGSLVVMFIIMKQWKRKKSLALLIAAGYGICFGYISAAAVLIVAILVASVFFIEKHKPDSPPHVDSRTEAEQRLNQKLSYDEKRELEEMKIDARHSLAPGDYAQFDVLARTCYTKKEFENLKRHWGPLIEQLKH